MSTKDYVIEVTDLQATEKMLLNAEIDFTVIENDDDTFSIHVENGVQFLFDDTESLISMEIA